jgi:glycosyltransferase involved in cell wall biosynthesis
LIRVILAVTNDIVTDNRLHKIAVSLGNYGYKVTIAGRRFGNSENIYGRTYKTRRFKLWFNKSALFYANYNIRLFFYLLKQPFDIIVANDLDTLPACWLASKLRKKVIVFDSHELFTEVPELVNRPIVKGFWKLTERLILPSIELGYTVSAPIQDYYKKKYKKDFELIRNVGMFQSEGEFKGFPEEVVIIYQGAVNIGRGIELMLEALKRLDGVKLWIIGHGDILSSLKNLTLSYGVQEKVIFFGKVPWEKLMRYTKQAHIGISLEEDLGLNYRYALPNKLFDYIQARIPMIVSNLPEMRSLVQRYGVGLILENRNSECLADTINQLINDPSLNLVLKQNLELAAMELCWQREEEKVILLYRKASAQVQVQNDR